MQQTAAQSAGNSTQGGHRHVPRSIAAENRGDHDEYDQKCARAKERQPNAAPIVEASL